MSEPTLFASVEVAEGPSNWVRTPAQPWPNHVRLNGQTTEEELALVMHVLAFYNSISQEHPFLSPHELAKEDGFVLPGGLACSDESRTIYPSCCAGLEDWREWYNLLDGTGTPWLGHDPSPYVQTKDETFLVWPNGGLNEPISKSDESIVFTRSRLETALERVSTDLVDFTSLLRSWCTLNVPEVSDQIVRTFTKSFRVKE